MLKLNAIRGFLCALIAGCAATAWAAPDGAAVIPPPTTAPATKPSTAPATRPAAKPARRARSVHLWYRAPASTVLYNEVCVRESQRGSYFMAIGFNHGYFGIQDLANGDKVVLFSVWDPVTGNDPAAVPPEERAKCLFQAPDVQVRRFGGEGTGGQCFFKYPWKLDTVYRLMVQAKVAGQQTQYSGYFYVPEDKAWKHLVTFQTTTGGQVLGGNYSFVEDFRRDGKSATESRRAEYLNGWAFSTKGKWQALTGVTFTGDDLPVLNINAGVVPHGFFLQTGGATPNVTPLKGHLQRTDADPKPPEDLVLPASDTGTGLP